LNGLVQLHSGATPLAWGLLGLAAVCLAVFVAWQRHQGRQGGEPLMDLRVFEHRQFAMGSIVAFIYGIALFGSTYLLPLYMQSALKLSASHVGALLLPSGLVLAITIALVGRLADRLPTYTLVCVGLSLLALSFVAMVLIRLGTPVWVLVLFAVVGRIGLGFILPSLNMGSMRGLGKALIAQGSSAISFIRMLGGAAGVSLCGILLEWRLAAHGDTLANPATSPARLLAFDEVFCLLAAVCALAIVAAWQLRPPKGAAV
jgi:predicted MFS family arabinose efflux permease